MTAIKLQPSKYSMILFVRDSVISVVLNAVDRPCCLFIQKVLCTASNHETVHWHRRGGFIYQPISDHTLPFVCLSWPTKSTIHLYVSLPACLPVDLSVYLATCLCYYFLTCLFVCLSALTSMIQGHQKPQARRKQGERQHCPACQHISLSGVQFYGPTIHLSENKLCKEAWQSWASSKVDEAPAWFRAQVWSLFYLALDPFRSYHKVLGIQL